MLMPAEIPRRSVLSLSVAQQTADWNDLREGYFRRIREAPVQGAERWNAAWRFVVAHRCYQRELDRRARRVLHAARRGFDWLDDVKQEAVLALSQDIRRETERGTPLDDSHILGWLCCVTTRNCQKAVRNIQRNRAASLVERDVEDGSVERRAVDDRLDVRSMIDTLAEFERTVVSHWMDGHTATDIAQLLQMSPRTVNRILRQARSRLRRLLCAETVGESVSSFQESIKNSCPESDARGNIYM
jgi:RNA polymerase sigma factor (sigma-70 family)